MTGFYVFSGIGLMLAGLICSGLILIDAIQNDAWDRPVWFMRGPYLCYYALFEYQSRLKWIVIAGAVCGNLFGLKLFLLGNGITS